ncbi:MAG TPA: heavy metal-binding domain-containing protein, partial [Duganella sp.]|nr:heavy metal-binding domain-containing protein [Duganella sp.]
MKNKSIPAAIAALAIAAGGYGAYRLGVHQGMQATPQRDGAAPAAAGKKPLYWHDPMVPGQKFDKPGKSPFMDMQLVPVYAGDDGDDGAVAISPRVQQNLGVRT